MVDTILHDDPRERFRAGDLMNDSYYPREILKVSHALKMVS